MEIFLLVLILVLVIVYFVRQKIILVLSQVLNLVFVVAAVVAITGVFWATPFTYLAQNTLSNGGTLTTIRKIDGTLSLDAVKNVGNSLYDNFLKLIGKEPQQQQNPAPKEAGVLEKEVYPSIVSSVAGIYRVTTTAIAIGTMAVVVYLGYTASGAAEVEVLKKRIAKLEKEVTVLNSPKS